MRCYQKPKQDEEGNLCQPRKSLRAIYNRAMCFEPVNADNHAHEIESQKTTGANGLRAAENDEHTRKRQHWIDRGLNRQAAQQPGQRITTTKAHCRPTRHFLHEYQDGMSGCDAVGRGQALDRQYGKEYRHH
jgi:hypothetical protein